MPDHFYTTDPKEELALAAGYNLNVSNVTSNSGKSPLPSFQPFVALTKVTLITSTQQTGPRVIVPEIPSDILQSSSAGICFRLQSHGPKQDPARTSWNRSFVSSSRRNR